MNRNINIKLPLITLSSSQFCSETVKMFSIAILIYFILLLVAPALATVHHLYVGNLFAPARIYSLEFDDVALSLSITRNMTAASSHAWIAFDVCFLPSTMQG